MITDEQMFPPVRESWRTRLGRRHPEARLIIAFASLDGYTRYYRILADDNTLDLLWLKGPKL